jgi:hypothetical protein
LESPPENPAAQASRGRGRPREEYSNRAALEEARSLRAERIAGEKAAIERVIRTRSPATVAELARMLGYAANSSLARKLDRLGIPRPSGSRLSDAAMSSSDETAIFETLARARGKAR